MPTYKVSQVEVVRILAEYLNQIQWDHLEKTQPEAYRYAKDLMP
jgi:hypothetical protein